MTNDSHSLLPNQKAPYATFFFDFTDLIWFFDHSRTPTGIQRVVMCLSLPALRLGATAVCFDAANGIWRAIPLALCEHVWAMSSIGAEPGNPEWQGSRSQLAEAGRSGPIVEFPRGATLVALGANWSAAFPQIREQQIRRGVRYAAFIHDTVPITFPEYCTPETVAQFRQWFASCVVNSDIIIVNSASTAEEMLHVCKVIGLPMQLPIVCKLEGAFERTAPREAPTLGLDVIDAISVPFVLFVGTLEPRKDHLTVLSCWRHAIGRLGADKVPTLVLVGRNGWQFEPVLAAIRNELLQGKVKQLADVSDHELAALYDNCLFTIYNSLHEGWGLPVSESISYGKVPVIPRHSGLIESGEGCAEFFDPGSKVDMLDKIIRLIEDDDYREARSGAIKTERSLVGWEDISQELVAAIAVSPSRIAAPFLDLGRIYNLSTALDSQQLCHYAMAEAVRGRGWHTLEAWGAWTSAPVFEMFLNYGRDIAAWGVISDEEDHFSTLLVHLLVRGHQSKCTLTFFADGRRCCDAVGVEPHSTAIVQVRLPRTKNHQLQLEVRQDALTHLAPHTQGEDKRVIGIGVESIMLCLESDLKARMAMIEHRFGYRVVASH